MNTEQNHRGTIATPRRRPRPTPGSAPYAFVVLALLGAISTLASACDRDRPAPAPTSAEPLPASPPEAAASAGPEAAAGGDAPSSPEAVPAGVGEGTGAAARPTPGPADRALAGDWPLWVGEPLVLADEAGLRLEAQRWRDDGASGQLWRVRVPRSGSAEVRAGEGIVPLASLVPADGGPWALVNGGFYDEMLRPMGLVVRDGEELAPLRQGGGSGVFAVDEGGVRIVHRDDYRGGASQALQSIDRLVDAGASVVRSRNPDRAARAAIALTDEAMWLVVAAGDESIRRVDDGVWLRQTARRGLSLGAFAGYLVAELGADTALNLDGGGSVNLSVRTESYSLDILGERGTCNGLLLRP